MTIQLPELPYALDALAPHMSGETLDFHYNKHHRGYVDKLNKLIADGQYAHATLEDIVRSADGTIFNNAAQVWNHTFFWHSMSPKGGGKPTGELAAKIDRDFGGFSAFQEAFSKKATEHFGSGWAWLVQNNDGRLSIIDTSDAETPLTTDHQRPLLTCDVWEHAYYIDYRNERAKFVSAFWNVVDWNSVTQRLSTES